MRVFAFDHRMQFEEMEGANPEKIGRFKELCLEALLQVANGREGYGLLCDNRLGQKALWRATGQGLWIGNTVELPGSRPLRLESAIGADFGGLNEWPREQVVKVLCLYHPDDSDKMKAEQEETLQRLFAASRRNGLEFLLEPISSKHGEVDENTVSAVIQRMYDIGIYPDWWKLEPYRSEACWAAAVKTIELNDPYTRGIVVLGLDATPEKLFESFSLAARYDLVKGFAVGRTIFSDAAKSWLAGEIGDKAAIIDMTNRYRALCDMWDKAKQEIAA